MATHEDKGSGVVREVDRRSPHRPILYRSEPMEDNQPRYTTKRLQDEIAKAKDFGRWAALEEAAALAEKHNAKAVAEAIRSLIVI